MIRSSGIFWSLMGVLAFVANIVYGLEDKKNEVVPEYLYKIVSIEDWNKSLDTDHVVLGEMDEDFIHLSKEDQFEHVLKKYWAGKDYVLLKVKTDALQGRLVYETNPGGSAKYYHLYEGAIPRKAVVDAKIVNREAK